MKKLPIIVGIIILFLITSVIFFYSKSQSKSKVIPTPTPEEESLIETIPVDSIDATITPRYDQKAFTIIIKGLLKKGFKEFEYEVSWETEDGLTQGSFSKEPIMVTNEDFEREILLGTCSKNVCRYDKGVENIKLTLRLKDKEGKTKIWENEFPLD